MKWPVVKIDSIKAGTRYALVGGPFGSNLVTRDYIDEGIPVIRGVNLPDDRSFLESDFVYVSEKKADELLSNNAYPGDLVFTQRGTLGQVGRIPEDSQYKRFVISQSQMKLTVAKEKADSRFVYYFFRSPEVAQKIKNLAITSGVPHINLGILKDFDIPLPPLITQQKVVSTLSAYDDLIENNLKRIALLEESARLLYREWFVRLRFPGYEHTRIVDGVPEGWERGCVGQLAKVQSGFAFKSQDWQDEGNPVIKIKNIGGSTIDVDDCQCVSDQVAEKAIKFLLKEGDFLIAMTGATVGKVGVMPRTERRYFLNQRVGVFNPKVEPNPTPLLFTFFNSEIAQKQVLNYAAGAAQPNISPSQIEAISLLLPNETLLKAYLETCRPLFEQRLVLLAQNQKLKQARDLLLPRLMNGEIEV